MDFIAFSAVVGVLPILIHPAIYFLNAKCNTVRYEKSNEQVYTIILIYSKIGVAFYYHVDNLSKSTFPAFRAGPPNVHDIFDPIRLHMFDFE